MFTVRDSKVGWTFYVTTGIYGIPPIVAGTLTALDLLASSGELREQLNRNAKHFRTGMQEAGFDVLPGEHAIVPVMFGDASLTTRIASELQRLGIFVTAFSYPVVPKDKARIRVQLSAVHTPEQIDRCIEAFKQARAAVS